MLHRNCLERINVMERRGRRGKQLLDDLTETRGFWALKEEALDRTLWRTRFGRGYGIVVRLRNGDRALYKMLLEAPPQWALSLPKFTTSTGIGKEKKSGYRYCVWISDIEVWVAEVMGGVRRSVWHCSLVDRDGAGVSENPATEIEKGV
jgi:hypothetical protein